MKYEFRDFHTLMNRIQPQLEKVDLDHDITDTINLAISLGSYPKIVPCELAKKLVVLQYQGKVNQIEITAILSNPKTNSLVHSSV